MFETSVVQARVAAQRRYGWLSVSLGVHSLVVIAVIAAGISSTSLPTAPPREFQVFFRAAAIPQPPPAPHVATTQPAQPHAAAATTVPHAATAPATLVTPLVIPNTIPTVQPSTGDNNVQIGNPSSSSDTNIIGDPNSVDVGPSTSNVTPVPDTVFHPGAEVKPAVVIQRVEPEYPHVALMTHVGGTVVLKCIIDKNGDVRDAEVVTSSFGAFEGPALNALRRWRFAPGSFRGKPVDTWFELTIKFVAK
jgi:protein TonB